MTALPSEPTDSPFIVVQPRDNYYCLLVWKNKVASQSIANDKINFNLEMLTLDLGYVIALLLRVWHFNLLVCVYF